MPKPKLPCTDRAQWRLVPGRPPDRLSAHYRLDCDYGTALIMIYKQGETVEPIYLCENHVNTVGRSSEKAPENQTRTIADQPDSGPNAAIPPERIEDRDVAPKAGMTLKNAPPAEPASSRVETPSPVEQPKDTFDSAKEDKEEKIGKQAARVAPEPSAKIPAKPSAKSPARDLAYGNPAKALVDETLWNLASGDAELYAAELQRGKSATEAAESAGGQLAAIHRKIDEYTPKLEALLSESKATIDVGAAIDQPLEQAMLDIITRSEISETQQDAAIQQLGALQESMKNGLHREMTASEARRIAMTLADRANWGGMTDIPEDLKPAYRAFYSSLRDALRAAVPDAQNLEERLANLYAAKSDLQDAAQAKAKALQPVTS